MKKIKGYLRLTRPANIVTAVSDVLAGLAIGGSLLSVTLGRMSYEPLSLGRMMIQGATGETAYLLSLLVLATAGLYGGGVVLNDVFDAELDKVERPERPIPSGLIKKSAATTFGVLLLLTGIVAAALTQLPQWFSLTMWLAVAIAVLAVVYDKWSKHHAFAGPLNMGVCRGLNLLLGMSIIDGAVEYFWYVALVPIVYIAAITMISRGEVHGGSRKTLYAAAGFYVVVLCSILLISIFNTTLTSSLPILLIFCLMIFLPLQRAILRPEPTAIGRAVKSGVMALIVMNACWAAAFGDIIFAGIIILLFPISYLLARLFAVT